MCPAIVGVRTTIVGVGVACAGVIGVACQSCTCRGVAACGACSINNVRTTRFAPSGCVVVGVEVVGVGVVGVACRSCTCQGVAASGACSVSNARATRTAPIAGGAAPAGSAMPGRGAGGAMWCAGMPDGPPGRAPTPGGGAIAWPAGTPGGAPGGGPRGGTPGGGPRGAAPGGGPLGGSIVRVLLSSHQSTWQSRARDGLVVGCQWPRPPVHLGCHLAKTTRLLRVYDPKESRSKDDAKTRRVCPRSAHV